MQNRTVQSFSPVLSHSYGFWFYITLLCLVYTWYRMLNLFLSHNNMISLHIYFDVLSTFHGRGRGLMWSIGHFCKWQLAVCRKCKRGNIVAQMISCVSFFFFFQINLLNPCKRKPIDCTRHFTICSSIVEKADLCRLWFFIFF